MGAENTERPSSKPLWLFLALLGLLSWPIWVASGVLPRAGAGAYDGRWLFAQIGVFGPSLAALTVSGALRKKLRRNNVRILTILLLPLAIPGALVAAASPSRIVELPLLPSIAAVIVAILVILFFLPLTRGLLSPGTGEPQERPQARVVLLSVTLLPALFLLAWLLVHFQGKGLEISALRGGALESAGMVVVIFSHNLLLGGSLGEEIGWRGFLLPELLRRMSPGAAVIVSVTSPVFRRRSVAE